MVSKTREKSNSLHRASSFEERKVKGKDTFKHRSMQNFNQGSPRPTAKMGVRALTLFFGPKQPNMGTVFSLLLKAAFWI